MPQKSLGHDGGTGKEFNSRISRTGASSSLMPISCPGKDTCVGHRGGAQCPRLLQAPSGGHRSLGVPGGHSPGASRAVLMFMRSLSWEVWVALLCICKQSLKGPSANQNSQVQAKKVCLMRLLTEKPIALIFCLSPAQALFSF